MKHFHPQNDVLFDYFPTFPSWNRNKEIVTTRAILVLNCIRFRCWWKLLFPSQPFPPFSTHNTVETVCNETLQQNDILSQLLPSTPQPPICLCYQILRQKFINSQESSGKMVFLINYTKTFLDNSKSPN